MTATTGLAASVQVRLVRHAREIGMDPNHVMARYAAERLLYRPETAIAEKLHAMVELGQANSRMRDFFDVDALLRQLGFELGVLSAAVRATFGRRRTPLPNGLPVALTPDFAAIPGKQQQWRAFLRRSSRDATTHELSAAIDRLAVFLAPVIAAARGDGPVSLTWPPGGPWQ